MKKRNDSEKFIEMFPDFNLIVKKVRVQKKKRNNKPSNPTNVLSKLSKNLRKLEKEYKIAKKSFKAGKLAKEELFDFEWRIFELKEELKKLEGDDGIL